MDYFEPYRQLAHRLGYTYGDVDTIDNFWLAPDASLIKQKCCWLMKDDLFFWAFDMYGLKFGMKANYSGVYRLVSLPDPSFLCRISRRFVLDFLVGEKRDKLGSPWIDKSVTLTTNNKEMARRMVTETLVKDYLQLPEALSPIAIVLGSDYLPRQKGHETEQVVGLETNRWYTAEELESYLPVMEAFVRKIVIPVS